MTPYSIIRILLTFVLEAVFVVTTTRVLTMRSNVAFYTVRLIYWMVTAINRDLGSNNPVQSPIWFLILNLGFPMVLSRGRLRTRVTHVLLITIDMILVDVLASTVFTLLADGSAPPTTMNAANTATVIFVYLLAVVMAIVSCEVIIMILSRIEGGQDYGLNAPTVLTQSCSLVCVAIAYGRFLGNTAQTLRPTVLALALTWISLAGSYLILAVARREATSQREAADAALAARKAKHTLSEVEGLSWRAEGMYALRHAFAGEARAVGRLAAAGEADEAARRLNDLRAQAHVLNAGHDR